MATMEELQAEGARLRAWSAQCEQQRMMREQTSEMHQQTLLMRQQAQYAPQAYQQQDYSQNYSSGGGEGGAMLVMALVGIIAWIVNSIRNARANSVQASAAPVPGFQIPPVEAPDFGSGARPYVPGVPSQEDVPVAAEQTEEDVAPVVSMAAFRSRKNIYDVTGTDEDRLIRDWATNVRGYHWDGFIIPASIVAEYRAGGGDYV